MLSAFVVLAVLHLSVCAILLIIEHERATCSKCFKRREDHHAEGGRLYCHSLTVRQQSTDFLQEFSAGDE